MKETSIQIDEDGYTAIQGELKFHHPDSADKAFAGLKELIKREIDWKNKLVDPSKEPYYFIGETSVETTIHYDGIGSKSRPSIRAFRTREQAEIVADRYDLLREMMQFAHVHNEDWIPDWNSITQRKYGIDFSGYFQPSYSYANNCFVNNVTVKSKKIAEKMLKEFKDKLPITNQQY